MYVCVYGYRRTRIDCFITRIKEVVVVTLTLYAIAIIIIYSILRKPCSINKRAKIRRERRFEIFRYILLDA